MQNGIFRTLALLAVLATIAAAVYIALLPNTPATIGINATDATHQYVNAALGLRFSYPVSYALSEHDATSTGGVPYHVISLIDKTAAANIPENGEGPVAITIQEFASSSAPLDHWIRSSPDSNFKLSPDHTLATTTLSGVSAYRYTWDGLYKGDTLAADSNGRRYMLSVTYADPSDKIRTDFDKLLAGLSL